MSSMNVMGGSLARLPERDGDLRSYFPSDPVPSTRQLVIYVNGMLTRPAAHAETAQMLADRLGIGVTGVYNLSGGTLSHHIEQVAEVTREACKSIAAPPRSERAPLPDDASWSARFGTFVTSGVDAVVDGTRNRASGACVVAAGGISTAAEGTRFMTDLAQSGDEYLRLGTNHAATQQYSVETLMFDHRARAAALLGAQWRRISRGMSSDGARRYFVESNILGGNIATRVLFELLMKAAGGGMNARVVAHSQGNLITSTALAGVAFMRQYRTLPVTVYAVASPAYMWPQISGFTLRGPYEHFTDPIPKLSMRAGNPIATQAGEGNAHAIENYIINSPLIRDMRYDMALR